MIGLVRIASPHVPPSQNKSYSYMLEHMWDDCPKWPFARNPVWGRAVMRLDGRTRYVHQVVCELVNGPKPTDAHEVAHTCGKGSEGCFGARCVTWKTRTENERDKIEHGTSNRGSRHGMSKLTEVQVKEIKRMKGAYTQEAIGEIYGVSPTAVGQIFRGKTWAWL